MGAAGGRGGDSIIAAPCWMANFSSPREGAKALRQLPVRIESFNTIPVEVFPLYPDCEVGTQRNDRPGTQADVWTRAGQNPAYRPARHSFPTSFAAERA